MTRFADEMMKAQQQLQLVRDGRGDEIQPMIRQQQAMKEFAAREVSPYFSRSKDSHMANRLQQIAQAIKKKAADSDSGRKTKVDASRRPMETSLTYGISSGNDADHDGGYVTAVGEH